MRNVVDSVPDGPQIIYIDKHLIHEVTTSPQALQRLSPEIWKYSDRKQIGSYGRS